MLAISMKPTWVVTSSALRARQNNDHVASWQGACQGCEVPVYAAIHFSMPRAYAQQPLELSDMYQAAQAHAARGLAHVAPARPK
jgi:hypothetical protein